MLPLIGSRVWVGRMVAGGVYFVIDDYVRILVDYSRMFDTWRPSIAKTAGVERWGDVPFARFD